MSLYTLGEICRYADKGGFAVPAFNCYNFETIKWIVEAAEEEKSPVITMIYPGFEEMMPLEYFVATARMAAERASVPIAVHLDHCYEYEHVLLAAHYGCTGVMADSSGFDFDTNVAKTREIVHAVHSFGVSVEAELGKVGSADNVTDFIDNSGYTDVNEAVRFVELTGVDALAVAIGSAHGNYVKEPRLDIERLSEINAAIDTPLVLHGGSGIPESQMQDAVRHGINKVNIATEYFANNFKVISEIIAKDDPKCKNHYNLMLAAKEPIKDFVKSRISLLRP